MSGEKLKEVVKAQPFRPFRLHFAGGRAFPVHRPDFIMVSPRGRTAAVYGRKDGLEIIDVFMVQSIEFSNGRGSRGRRGA